jgi:cytochrome c
MAQSNIGRPATPDEIAAWDIDVRPDGVGLPAGAGDVTTGEELFSTSCVACHGDFGEGLGLYPTLAGGNDTLTGTRPVKSIGAFVPYLSTIFDYINRAKPYGDAQSLSADETYALVAYLLYLNDLVDDDFTLSRENFTEIRLPNEANFFPDDRATAELPRFSAAPCMNNCKDSVEITSRGLTDVTPGGDPNKVIIGTQVALGVETENAALIAAGEKLFKNCAACHQIGPDAKNRLGPRLTGVLGRAAATEPGYKYSRGMKLAAQDGLVWDAETLSQFLANPPIFVRGTRMLFAGFKTDDEIAAMVAYLGQF